MTRLVLHVGLPKTGTTSIQWQLWEMNDELLRRGVNAIASRQMPAYHELSQALMQLEPKLDAKQGWMAFENAKIDAMWPTWSDQIHTQILSQEDLHLFESGGFERLYEFASPHELRVVMSLRNPADWLMSVWKHSLKTSKAETWPRFLAVMARHRIGSPHKHLKVWVDKDRLQDVRLFMVDPKQGGDSFSDFVRAAGLEGLVKDIPIKRARVDNVAPSLVQGLYGALFAREVRERLIDRLGDRTVELNRHDRLLYEYNDREISFVRDFAKRMTIRHADAFKALLDDSSHEVLDTYLVQYANENEAFLTEHRATLDEDTAKVLETAVEMAQSRIGNHQLLPAADAMERLPVDSNFYAFVDDFAQLSIGFFRRYDQLKG